MDHIKYIAVLMTCHNRCETTLKCLHSFYSQTLPGGVNFKIYLVDDGCTDGTGDVVRQQFPDVNILRGDGNLYWCGGMRLAWETASEVKDYDYYLWLNDDTYFYPNCVEKLLVVAEEKRIESSKSCIAIGSLCDSDTGQFTYGGRLRKKTGKSIAAHLVEPSGVPQKCDMINGNCVLVPREIFETIGNLSTDFTHAIADNDYGFRTVIAGFDIWVVPGFVGTCSKNPPATWSSSKTPIFKRLKLLYSPNGLNIREFSVFLRRHVGWRWIFYWLKAHIRIIVPKLWSSK